MNVRHGGSSLCVSNENNKVAMQRRNEDVACLFYRRETGEIRNLGGMVGMNEEKKAPVCMVCRVEKGVSKKLKVDRYITKCVYQACLLFLPSQHSKQSRKRHLPYMHSPRRPGTKSKPRTE